MRIVQSRIFRYAIPFVAPLRLTGRELAVREGYIAMIFSETGNVGIGEIAPLPGLHRELPEEAALQLHTVLAGLTGRPLPHIFSPLDGVYCLPPVLHPSVRTGMEMALLNLFAAESLLPLPDLPGYQGHAGVPLNGLVSGTVGAMEEQAEHLVAEGYRTLKLKVGRMELRQEIAMVRFIRSVAGPEIILRLDANRSWTLDTAVEFGKAVEELNIEYIEEPLADPALLPEFTRSTGIRSALDESLAAGRDIPSTLDPDAIAALVLKPSVVGGIAQTMHLIRLAQQHSILSVLSSAFETGVALGMYACLASLANDTEVACGLDTYKSLEHDILTAPFRADNSVVDVRRAWMQSGSLRAETLHTMYSL